ncbi:MAG: NAD(+) diphosphatase [Pseudomonadota bacterium]
MADAFDVSFCPFAGAPLNRATESRGDAEWLKRQAAHDDALLIPLWRGDPLMVDGAAGWLAHAARSEFARSAPIVFLGLDLEGPRAGRPRFALDCGSVSSPDAAPFSDLGRYVPLREAIAALTPDDLAMVGQGRWLLDWHRRHVYCAVCGAETDMVDGGAKRVCPDCGAEHFPRSDPVSIVLALHDDACLLGRNSRFPPNFYSALAGYVEACETPEECAVRELNEEAGVTLSNVRYQFSQPWPFPSSMMMGFFADSADRELTLDETEIADAVWLPKDDARAIMAGTPREIDGRTVFLPPRFTIARRLIEAWAE